MEINFDMDGTIADLYGVSNWLDALQHEDSSPYKNAKPMVNMSVLARHLNRLQRNGYKVNVISWLAKNGSEEYGEEVAQAKKEWLGKHLPSVHFDNVNIVAYGTPKQTLGNGILFDDEEPNRTAWTGTAYDEKNILDILRNMR